MQINETDVNGASGFYIVNFETFTQTLDETEVVEKWDLGAIAIIHGTRYCEPIWLIDNPAGKYAIWVEESRG